MNSRHGTGSKDEAKRLVAKTKRGRHNASGGTGNVRVKGFGYVGGGQGNVRYLVVRAAVETVHVPENKCNEEWRITHRDRIKVGFPSGRGQIWIVWGHSTPSPDHDH